MRAFTRQKNEPQRSVPAGPSLSKPTASGPQPASLVPPAQRAIGIQVGREVAPTRAVEPEAGATGVATPRRGHDFSRFPVHDPAEGAMQPKLAINTPGDGYEQEADR